jgi:hypothetical protein
MNAILDAECVLWSSCGQYGVTWLWGNFRVEGDRTETHNCYCR